jgi:3-oxoacyl-[acyl-carrier-protein] synthase II
MEREDDAKASARETLGIVRGYGCTTDAFSMVSPAPDGLMAGRAISEALRDAGACPDDVGHINAHGTGTQLNDRIEAEVLNTVFGSNAPPVTANKGVTGHLLGGSGALEAVASCLAARARQAPPTGGLEHQDPAVEIDVVAGASRSVANGTVLSTSFGFGGQNAALLIDA